MINTTLIVNNFEFAISKPPRAGVVPAQASAGAFFGIATMLSVVSAVLTVRGCNTMSAMGGMPMPGGWEISMVWMRMPGQTWGGALASFVGMWVVMMIAMMLPSFMPMLARYRAAVDSTRTSRIGRLTTLVGLGYYFVWTLFGLAVFPAGVAIAFIEMSQPALAPGVPILTGVIVLIAGAVQFTTWKSHHLACCREAPVHDCVLPAESGTAWRAGLRFGIKCGLSCANLTAVLLVVGVMDLRAMAAVTAAITAERLAPNGQSVARNIGVVAFGTGLLLIAHAVGLR
jgi:predicted metal-binding membrane protein